MTTFFSLMKEFLEINLAKDQIFYFVEAARARFKKKSKHFLSKHDCIM